MESLKHLIEELGYHTARTIIESQIVYPKTSNLQEDNALVNLEFENSLSSVIRDLQNDIQLKAVDAFKDAVTVLSMIEEFEDSILLAKADMVVVYKGGMDILKLTNKENPNSGRSIYIEVNSCRNELIRIIQTARGKNIPWLKVGIAVGVALLVLFQVQNKK